MTRNSTVSGPASLLGYDSALLSTLPLAYRRALDSLSQAWLFSCVLLSLPVGLSMWFVEHSLTLSGLVAVAAFLLVLNLLRLVNSGSGTAPEHRMRRKYRPSLLPVALIFGLALMMSQPAQLLHTPDSVDQAVRVHRAELMSSHERAQQALHGTRESEPGDKDAFVAELERCEFVVLRLKLLWEHPQSALLWTALFVGLVLSPAALTRVLWLNAVIAYERKRHFRARMQIRSLVGRTECQVDSALRGFSSFRPPWPVALTAPHLAIDPLDLNPEMEVE